MIYIIIFHKFILNIMLEFFISAILIIVVFVFYKFYYVPNKKIQHFKEVIEKLGYKVYVRPFAFMGLSVIKQNDKGLNQHGDSYFAEKNIDPQYDVVIGNAIHDIVIALVNQELLKSFYSPQNASVYEKSNIGYAGLIHFLGKGLLFSEGNAWKQKRKILSQVFTFELLKQNISKMSQICDKKMNSIEQQSKVNENQFSFQIFQLGSMIFNGVMMKCFFGTDEIKEKIEDDSYELVISKLIDLASEVSIAPPTLIFGQLSIRLGLTKNARQMKRKITIFRAISEQIVSKRMKEVKLMKAQGMKKVGSDIIEAIVFNEQASQQEKQQQVLTSQDIIDEFCTFVAAGTDTTANYFQMLVYLICEHPEVEAKLRKLIKENIKSNEDLTYQNIKNFTYIDWIQNETTRYYNPINGIFTRVAKQDHFIGGIPIPKGINIALKPMGNHYNPNIFENPHEFRPERWQKQCDSLHPFAFIGFSGGARTCIGKNLALIESKIALIKLFQRYSKIVLPTTKRVMERKFLYHAKHIRTTFIKDP